MDCKDYLDNIERKLKNNFNIKKDYDVNGYKYDLYAEFHLRNERYVFTKKTVLDAFENNEYIFFKYFDFIDEIYLKKYIDFLVSSIDDIIKPDNNHMSSIFTGVILLDNKPKDKIIETIKKFKYHKAFAFGFKGWVDIRLILVTMKDEYIVTSKKGKEVKEVYSIY